MKRVLLTGGAGSIGIHTLTHILKNRDWEVVVIDSFRHKGYHARLAELKKSHPEWDGRWSVIQHDLACPIAPSMEEEIGHIDYIIHLAAISDVFLSVENPVYAIQNNINSTLMMLEYARKVKPEQFIYFSTDEVYGPVEKGGAHSEWDTHRPSNAYSASKAASEDICYAYWRSYGVPLIVTNTMNNFGEMQSATKFPVIVQKKLEAGETVTIHGNEKEEGTRFYIHSRNASDALLRIMDEGAHQHEVGTMDEPRRYHIVGEVCLSNQEMAETIAKIMGKPLTTEIVDFHKDNPGHDIHYGLENNNLRALGWSEPVSFEEAMKQTIEWQQSNREWIE